MITLVVAAVPGNAAEDPVAKRDAARSKRNQVQTKLDLARASDAKVEAEVKRLNGAVAVQQARVNSVSQAEVSARAEAKRAERELTGLESRSEEAKRLVAARAVDAYVHPMGTNRLMGLAQTANLDEASRRQTLLSVIQASTAELIGSLRAAREDQAGVTEELAGIQRKAAARVATEMNEQQDLVAARSSQQSTQKVLEARITGLQEETKQLAAEEGRLGALLRQRQAAAPRASPGGSVVSGVPSRAGLIWPLQGPVTSEFGPRWGGFHPGMDIAPPAGTPIRAAKAGVVISAGPYGGYGNFVVIDHGGGLATAYAHQSRIAVSDGQSVSQGQVIGYVGNTGFSTGPHLHFEVRVGGSAQNPRAYESGGP